MIRFLFSILTLPFLLALPAWAEELTLQYYEGTPAPDNWSDSYYILFGVAVGAAVLFVMAVMKKPDEIV